jgi:hypothetical protein
LVTGSNGGSALSVSSVISLFLVDGGCARGVVVNPSRNHMLSQLSHLPQHLLLPFPVLRTPTPGRGGASEGRTPQQDAPPFRYPDQRQAARRGHSAGCQGTSRRGRSARSRRLSIRTYVCREVEERSFSVVIWGARRHTAAPYLPVQTARWPRAIGPLFRGYAA